MTFRVVASIKARGDIVARAEYLRERDERAAGRWLAEIVHSLEELRTMPRRFGPAREGDASGRELRQLVVGRRGHTHRVIFEVSDERAEVRVYGVLASAQDDLDAAEIEGAEFPEEPRSTVD